MDDLIFTQENVENLLLEAGFSDIESISFVSFEEPNAFRTEAFLHKNSSRAIYVLIECLGDQIGISMQDNIKLEILKNQRHTILSIEKGKIYERNNFELNAFNSTNTFYAANRKLTNFISKLTKITLQ